MSMFPNLSHISYHSKLSRFDLGCAAFNYWTIVDRIHHAGFQILYSLVQKAWARTFEEWAFPIVNLQLRGRGDRRFLNPLARLL